MRPDFMQDKAYTTPEEILAKLVRKIHQDYPTLTNIKDLLNLIGEPKGIKFSDPSYQLSLGVLIDLICDSAPLISAPEC